MVQLVVIVVIVDDVVTVAAVDAVAIVTDDIVDCNYVPISTMWSSMNRVWWSKPLSAMW